MLRRDFALAHSFEECEVNDLLLSFGQELNHALQQSGQIVVFELARRGCDLVGEGVIDIALQALGRATISRLSTQAVKRAPARKRNQKPTEAPLVWIIPASLVPDLEQNIVKNIVDLRFVANHSQNDRTEQRFVPQVDAFKCFAFPLNNSFH